MAAIEAKKTDRRVIRTRSAIRKAFTDLLAETAYSKITITALAKRADVDRKTFYTHYSSVDNLLEDVIRTQTERSLEGIDFRDFFADPPRAPSVSWSLSKLHFPLPANNCERLPRMCPSTSTSPIGRQQPKTTSAKKRGLFRQAPSAISTSCSSSTWAAS